MIYTRELNDKEKQMLPNYGIDLSVLENVTATVFDPGEEVTHHGDMFTSLYIISDGIAKISQYAENGRSFTFSYYVTNELIGDIEIFMEKPIATTTVSAFSELTCITIPFYKNADVLKENIVFMNYIATTLAKKLNDSGIRQMSALYSSEERLCTYILKNQQKGKFYGTLSEMAQAIGVSYRHVFRIVDKLVRDGILKKTESGIIIMDKKKLENKSIN